MYIAKRFSDKTKKLIQSHIDSGKLTWGDLIGLTKAKIIHYSLTPKIFTNVSRVFNQTIEEDMELLEHYYPIFKSGRTKWASCMYVAMEVNRRIKYSRDITNWGASEYWARPIETHRRKEDDCDGYAVLITKVLRLCGLSDYEVFTSVGPVRFLDGKSAGLHAYVLVLDKDSLNLFPLEGSFYGSKSTYEFAKKLNPLICVKNKTTHPRYDKPWWITNDKHSFSNTKWFGMKLIR